MTVTDTQRDQYTLAMPDRGMARSHFWRNHEVSWSTLLEWMEEPATHKESRPYVGGAVLKSGRRTKENIDYRSILTLDADSPEDGFTRAVAEVIPGKVLIHSTYSSTDAQPRYRVLAPLSRRVTPQEYTIIAQAIMESVGIGSFDVGGREANRFLWGPAHQEGVEFWYWHRDGQVVDADAWLDDPAADLSVVVPTTTSAKRNPLTLGGLTGAFNRWVDSEGGFSFLIDQFDLPYVATSTNRWRFEGTHAAPGVSLLGDDLALVFSNHINRDPMANGSAHTMFDVLRIHLYGDLDDDDDLGKRIQVRPSTYALQEALMKSADYEAFRAFAISEGSDVLGSVESDFDAVDAEPNGSAPVDDQWRGGLTMNKAGAVEGTVHNLDLLRSYDPVFSRIRFNDFSQALASSQRPPWRSGDHAPGAGTVDFTDADLHEFGFYLEREYGLVIQPKRLTSYLNSTAARDHFSPVQEYLDSVRGTWDGVPRVESCLPGVQATQTNRIAARTFLHSAVRRAYEPGCKVDQMLVIVGPEGLGKTLFFERLAKGFLGTLGSVGSKDTRIAMQRAWIMLSDEGHEITGADWDTVKSFITQTVDVYRPPYGTVEVAMPRHVVFAATSNDTKLLSRREGNRRMMVVEAKTAADFDSMMDDAYIDQLWAESVAIYDSGEVSTYLPPEEQRILAESREEFYQVNEVEGLVVDYLETPMLGDWGDMSPEDRRRADRSMSALGDLPERVCSLQIAVEAVGVPLDRARDRDLLSDIRDILDRTPGWTKQPGRHRVKGYGPQMVWTRDDVLEGIL